MFPFSLFLGNAVIEIIMCTIGIIFLVHCIKTKDFKWMQTDWVKVAFVFWMYICLRSLFAENPQVALARGLPFIRYIFFAAAIAFWLLRDNKPEKYIIASLVLSIIFFGTSAITQYILGKDFFGNPYIGLVGNIRLTTAAGKMAIGMMLTLILFPALAYLFYHNKSLALIYALIGSLAVFLSGERTALLLLCVGFALIALSFRRTRVYVAAVSIIISVVVLTLYVNQSPIISRQVHSTSYEISHFSQTSYGRIYSTAMELFLSDPIFGIGLRHFQSECLSEDYYPMWEDITKPHLTKSYLCVTHPHNIYLEVLTETGLIGMLLFVLMISCWLKFAWKVRDQIKKYPIKIGALINICIKLIPIAASSSLFIAWPTAPLWFMVGILYAKVSR